MTGRVLAGLVIAAFWAGCADSAEDDDAASHETATNRAERRGATRRTSSTYE
jgi:hypothetical protein